MAQTARQVGETASASYDQGRETMEAYEGSLEERMRAKPLQCIAIAAGVGPLLGLIWKKYRAPACRLRWASDTHGPV